MSGDSRAFVRTCSCCGRGLDEQAWAALPLCGQMRDPDDGRTFEMRTCTCGSTLSRRISSRPSTPGSGVSRV